VLFVRVEHNVAKFTGNKQTNIFSYMQSLSFINKYRYVHVSTLDLDVRCC